MEVLVIIIFVLGYVAIAFEHSIEINKSATALVAGILCWTIYATFPIVVYNADAIIHTTLVKDQLAHHLGEIASILFFLMGAMTIVELVDAHHGFRIITDFIKTKNMVTLLWVISLVTFFLSAVLDNLTTAIVMVSLTRKLISDREQRLFFGGIIVLAANAGGAWSPIGDVTTTMLWIGGQISSFAIVKGLFLPSLLCMVVPLVFLSVKLKNAKPLVSSVEVHDEKVSATNSRIMLIVGVGSLVFVPVFKTITHLPPFMGILFGLAIVWVLSEFLNPSADEQERKKFSAGYALSRIDIPSMLFFMGILLAVGALQSMHILSRFASVMDQALHDNRIIISMIGVVSAVVDNVPLVAACMGMYSLNTYPMDNMMWEYLAYCAGTGGSLLIIGSAAGVAVMGMEKIDFIWYLKRISLLAFMGYAAGALVFLAFN
jgi:NhaD family Na+/H+ antiporter